MRPPRTVPAWDDFYMGLAFMAAARSKDPDTQHGAIVVDRQHRPWGMGCNGAPRQIRDDEVDWSRPAKYGFVGHAEIAALKHCRTSGLDDLAGCTIYVTGKPCQRCAMDIVSRGLGRIVYGGQTWASFDEAEWREVLRLCDKAGVQVEPHAGNLGWVADRLDWLRANVAGALPNLGAAGIPTGNKEDPVCHATLTLPRPLRVLRRMAARLTGLVRTSRSSGTAPARPLS